MSGGTHAWRSAEPVAGPMCEVVAVLEHRAGARSVKPDTVLSSNGAGIARMHLPRSFLRTPCNGPTGEC